MYRSFGKRVLDLVLVLAFSPLWVFLAAWTALIVRVALGRPIIFAQRRPGRGRRPFTLYKFRTMREAESEDGTPLPDERRMTTVGALLRKLSIDELPELVNVLRGDMSLVGPRPLLMEYLPLYTERQARRHEVLPGVTGWAQISGRNDTDWDERLEQDVWYVEHQSFKLDVMILLKTIPSVVFRRGINQPGEETMRRFEG